METSGTFESLLKWDLFLHVKQSETENVSVLHKALMYVNRVILKLGFTGRLFV